MKNNYPKNRIFEVLSEIPLDIEGSNLSNTGWYPHGIDKEYMNDKQIAEAISEAQNRDKKVLFKNVFLDWDSCDCNDGMCSHGSWVYEIVVMEGEKRYEIGLDEDYMIADYESRAGIPLKCTVYDFYRMCELVGIPLQFSEYAKSLLNN